MNFYKLSNMEFKGTKGNWLNDNGEIHNDNGRFIADCLILDEEDLYNSILISNSLENLKLLNKALEVFGNYDHKKSHSNMLEEIKLQINKSLGI